MPCGVHTSVEAQATDFPVKGLKGPCQKDNDDYWMAFGIGDITMCFLMFPASLKRLPENFVRFFGYRELFTGLSTCSKLLN